MRFSMISKMCLSGLMVAGLALVLVGCSPESSTTTNKLSGSGAGSRPKEQTGTSLGDSSIDKGREAPEPNPADKTASEKPHE